MCYLHIYLLYIHVSAEWNIAGMLHEGISKIMILGTYLELCVIFFSSITGRASLDTIVPDTITTWTAEAVALSSDKGLGVSPEASLTVKKALFASLELPYSLNWGETLKITPLVFNLQRSISNANISITVTMDEELSLLEPEPPSLLSVSITIYE